MFDILEPVKVRRTAGHLEDGWFFATNLALGSPYHAPEIRLGYLVRVVKPLEPGADLGDPETLVAEKHVTLGDLVEWQAQAE